MSFSYGNEEVLTNINVQIHKGDYVGMVGQNGAGKSTLVKIILGLLKHQAGSIKLFGQPIESFKNQSKIAYVPQKVTHFDDQFPVTVYEVVLMGTYARRGMFRRSTLEDRKSALEALKKVGITALKDRNMGELSGGEQQKVFVARALAGHPELMVLDEPTTGVDMKSQTQFYALLRTLNQEGITLILVSHDIEMIAREVMHVLCVDRTLTYHRTPQEFLNETATHRLFGKEVKMLTPHHHGLAQ